MYTKGRTHNRCSVTSISHDIDETRSAYFKNYMKHFSGVMIPLYCSDIGFISLELKF